MALHISRILHAGYVLACDGWSVVIEEPDATIAVTAVAPAVEAPAGRMPKVTGYQLPTEALVEVAMGSGLQWVNSDAAKIAAVQAAIAAEPKPLHVPRERPAPVVLDDRPLVLVETRRDLRDLKLPFEENPTV